MKAFSRTIRHLSSLLPPDGHDRSIRYRRLDYVNEAAYSCVWSLRFTRRQAVLLAVLAVSAMAALIYVVMAFTPLRRLLPGALDHNTRARYIENTLRIDSLTRVMRINERYLSDVEAIISGRIDPDSARMAHTAATELTDTLVAASDAERAFVQNFENSQRYNLSVLAPIAAEGMAFYSPAPGAEAIPSADGHYVELKGSRGQGVDAIYRGTVITAYIDARGLYTIVMQHPNEFISVYGGLAECYTTRGATPLTGSRIGAAGADGTLHFELGHKGNALNPEDYVAF